MRKLFIALSLLLSSSLSAQVVFTNGPWARSYETPAALVDAYENLQTNQKTRAIGVPFRIISNPAWANEPDRVTHALIVQPLYPDEEQAEDAPTSALYASSWSLPGGCTGSYVNGKIDTYTTESAMLTGLNALDSRKLNTAGFGKFPTTSDRWYIFYRDVVVTCP